LIGFLDVLLRGLALCGQALAVGGVFFGLLILRPAARADARWAAAEPRTLLLIAAGAAAVVMAQGLSVSLQLGSLVSELDSSLRTALATSYFAASVARTLVCGLVIATAIGLRRRTPSLGAWLVLVGLSLLLPLGAAGTSHAAARLEHRVPLLALDALHQLAAGVWVGGLFHLVVAASRDGRRPWPTVLLQRFSALSFAAVILMSAGTVSGGNDGPTLDRSCGPPSAVFVIVARMGPSTTSGFTERKA